MLRKHDHEILAVEDQHLQTERDRGLLLSHIPAPLPLSNVAVSGWHVGLFKGRRTRLDEQPRCSMSVEAVANFKRLVGTGIDLKLQRKSDHPLLPFHVADISVFRKLKHTT